jgi:RNA polymerase sigma-70 factor (ECF subfamily)
MSEQTLSVANDHAEQRPEVYVGAYTAPLRRYLARHVRPRSDLDDVVQEVFARLLRRSGEGGIHNVEGYIFQIAANLLRERGRQRANRNTAPAIELEPSLLGQGEEHSPERILLAKEAGRRLVDALNELPDRTRGVFILNRFEGMAGPEIAERLGISVSGVEKHMMRALAHLKARVRE